MSCCTNIKNLGCKNFCSTIETGVNAPATDTYVIEDSYTGDFFEVDITSGAEIEFTNRFNEDRVTVFKIKRESTGAYILDGLNDCYQVAVKAGISLDNIAQGTDTPSGGDGAILAADNFTTNGSGVSPALVDEASGDSFVSLGVTIVDVWINQTGEQGVKIPTADYTYNSITGVITGLDNSKNYTAYGR